MTRAGVGDPSVAIGQLPFPLGDLGSSVGGQTCVVSTGPSSPLEVLQSDWPCLLLGAPWTDRSEAAHRIYSTLSRVGGSGSSPGACPGAAAKPAAAALSLAPGRRSTWM